MSFLSPYNGDQVGYNRLFLEPPSEGFPRGRIAPVFVNWFKYVVKYLSDWELVKFSETNSVLHKVIQVSFNPFKSRVLSEIEKTQIDAYSFVYLAEQEHSPRAVKICKSIKLNPPLNIDVFNRQVELAKSFLTHDANLGITRVKEWLPYILDPEHVSYWACFLKVGVSSLLSFVLNLNTAQIQNLVEYCARFPDTEVKNAILEFMQMILMFKNMEGTPEEIDDAISRLPTFLAEKSHLLVDQGVVLSQSQYVRFSVEFCCWGLTKKRAEERLEFFQKLLTDLVKQRVVFPDYFRDKKLVLNMRDRLENGNHDAISSIFTSFAQLYKQGVSTPCIIVHAIADKDLELARRMLPEILQNMPACLFEQVDAVLQQKWDIALESVYANWRMTHFNDESILKLIEKSSLEWLRKNSKKILEVCSVIASPSHKMALLVALADRLDQSA